MERVLETKSDEVESSPLSGSVILVVDDDEDIRSSARSSMSDPSRHPRALSANRWTRINW